VIREFNVVIEKDEDDYFVATVPSLRGCHAQAKSLDTLMKRIRESIMVGRHQPRSYTEPFAGGRMQYRVAIHESEEGFSVSVPGLPGCWSQGATEAEAIENIKDAIREYLAVVDEQLRGEQTREIELTV